MSAELLIVFATAAKISLDSLSVCKVRLLAFLPETVQQFPDPAYITVYQVLPVALSTSKIGISRSVFRITKDCLSGVFGSVDSGVLFILMVRQLFYFGLLR